ncbi:MAG: alkaline phosphatase [Chthoniobacterales bacterium]
MKWRNQLLALVCLAVFAGLGVFYFQNWVVQKPFAIILFVGEGLTSQRLAATRVYAGGADTPLAIDGLERSARLRNFSADFAVPDAGAAASAIATGAKVRNGALSVDESGAALRTIVEIAHEQGRAVGLVSDGELTNPTMAAFYAHQANGKSATESANQLVNHAAVDIALGGGAARFSQMNTLEREHIRVARTMSQLEEMSSWQRGRVLGIFAGNDLAFSDDVAARSEQPSLSEMVRRAIEVLELNRHGYLLVVDAHLMASAAWQNLGERTLRETAELDRAVRIAREYAGSSSAVVVAGDVAIGGMNVNGYPFRYDNGVAILGLNSAGQPWITWATGQNGPRAAAETTAPESTAPPEPAAVQAPAGLNTIEDPVAAAGGLRVERLHGTLDNTALFSLLRDAL